MHCISSRLRQSLPSRHQFYTVKGIKNALRESNIMPPSHPPHIWGLPRSQVKQYWANIPFVHWGEPWDNDGREEYNDPYLLCYFLHLIVELSFHLFHLLDLHCLAAIITYMYISDVPHFRWTSISPAQQPLHYMSSPMW